MARQELFEILLDRIEARLLQDEPINAYIAVRIAAEFNHQSVVDSLLKRASRFGMNIATHRALQLAAKNGNDAMCRCLVDEGALDDFDPSDPHNDIIEEILVTAIAAGNVTLIKQTIASFCLTLTRPFSLDLDFGGDSVLEIAAEQGSIKIFKRIHSWGMPLEQRDPWCNGALLRATAKENTDIVSYFLQHDFDINGTYYTHAFDDHPDFDEDDDLYEYRGVYLDITLLIQSVVPWNGSDVEPSRMTEFLLDLGAEADTVGYKGRTALAEVAMHGFDISIAKLLIDRGANPLWVWQVCMCFGVGHPKAEP